MRLIEARSPADAWIQASQVLLKEGNNLGDINEILNLVIEIDNNLLDEITNYETLKLWTLCSVFVYFHAN